MSQFNLLNKRKCFCFQLTWNKGPCKVSCHHFASVSFSNCNHFLINHCTNGNKTWQTCYLGGPENLIWVSIQNLRWVLGHLCFLIGGDFKNLLLGHHMCGGIVTWQISLYGYKVCNKPLNYFFLSIWKPRWLPPNSHWMVPYKVSIWNYVYILRKNTRSHWLSAILVK